VRERINGRVAVEVRPPDESKSDLFCFAAEFIARRHWPICMKHTEGGFWVARIAIRSRRHRHNSGLRFQQDILLRLESS
jgi:hypothetical protein